MSKFLKILGGAVIGVGAVAAAPFTGGGSVLGAAGLIASLTGAGTIALATGAGVAGAVAANTIVSSEEEEIRNKIDREKIRHEIKLKEVQQRLDKVLNDTAKMYDYVIAMYSVGLSVANADNQISDEERKDIELFVSGIMGSKIPDDVKSEIQKLTDAPPSIQTAFTYLKKAGLTEEGWKRVDQVIEVVINSDDYEHQGEKNYRDAWRELRKSA